MTAPDLLHALRERGAVVTAEGSTLWVKPRSVLTDEWRAEIHRLKPELLALLAEQPSGRQWQPCGLLPKRIHTQIALAWWNSGRLPNRKPVVD